MRVNCCRCCKNSYFFYRHLRNFFCNRLNYRIYFKMIFIFNFVINDCRGCVAGHYDGFYVFVFQKIENIYSKFQKLFRRFFSIRHIFCIAKVNIIFIWQYFFYLFKYRYSADSGIKKSYGAVI